MKISDKDRDFSEKVTERFIELSKQGKIYYSDELRIFDLFQDKYKPVSIAEYARLTGRQYKVIQDKINAGTIAAVCFGDKAFVLTKLNANTVKEIT
jgi:predicted transcriptional regulator